MVTDKVILPNLCLQNVVDKFEELNRSPTTDTKPRHGSKTDTAKGSRKGEGEKGKPGDNSKSESKQEKVILQCNTVNCKFVIMYFIWTQCCASGHCAARNTSDFHHYYQIAFQNNCFVPLAFIGLDILIRLQEAIILQYYIWKPFIKQVLARSHVIDNIPWN